MDFQKLKRDILSKDDKSRKGEIDKPIRKLCAIINEKEQYCTTSSCSGRIVLLQTAKGNKKNQSVWLLNSHEKITAAQFSAAVKKAKKGATIYFLMESFILHVACDIIESAKGLIALANGAGIKRAHIFSIKEHKIMVELIGNERIEMPIVTKGKVLLKSGAEKALIASANEKLKKTHSLIKKLEKKMKE